MAQFWKVKVHNQTMATFGPYSILESQLVTRLRDHLQRTARNATYTSPDTRDQLTSILGDHIRDVILRKVRSSLCYTVIADEVTDCSNKEQLSIVLRYVESETSFIQEDLVTFLECDSGTTGEALADQILTFVKNYLDPSKMRGQAYDGASNMSGKTSGTAARISSKTLLPCTRIVLPTL